MEYLWGQYCRILLTEFCNEEIYHGDTNKFKCKVYYVIIYLFVAYTKIHAHISSSLEWLCSQVVKVLTFHAEDPGSFPSMVKVWSQFLVARNNWNVIQGGLNPNSRTHPNTPLKVFPFFFSSVYIRQHQVDLKRVCLALKWAWENV